MARLGLYADSDQERIAYQWLKELGHDVRWAWASFEGMDAVLGKPPLITHMDVNTLVFMPGKQPFSKEVLRKWAKPVVAWEDAASWAGHWEHKIVDGPLAGESLPLRVNWRIRAFEILVPRRRELLTEFPDYPGSNDTCERVTYHGTVRARFIPCLFSPSPDWPSLPAEYCMIWSIKDSASHPLDQKSVTCRSL